MPSRRDKQVCDQFAGQIDPAHRILANWVPIKVHKPVCKTDVFPCWLCPRGLQRGYKSFIWENKLTKCKIHLGKDCHVRLYNLVYKVGLQAKLPPLKPLPVGKLPQAVRVDDSEDDFSEPEEEGPKAVRVDDSDEEEDYSRRIIRLDVTDDEEDEDEEDYDFEEDEDYSEAEEAESELDEEPEFKELSDEVDLDSYEWEYKEVLEEGKYDSLVNYWPVRCSRSTLPRLQRMFGEYIKCIVTLSDGSTVVYWKPTRTLNENIKD